MSLSLRKLLRVSESFLEYTLKIGNKKDFEIKLNMHFFKVDSFIVSTENPCISYRQIWQTHSFETFKATFLTGVNFA